MFSAYTEILKVNKQGLSILHIFLNRNPPFLRDTCIWLTKKVVRYNYKKDLGLDSKTFHQTHESIAIAFQGITCYFQDRNSINSMKKHNIKNNKIFKNYPNCFDNDFAFLFIHIKLNQFNQKEGP